MAKNDVMKALATLRESGLKLTKEQESALEEFTSQALRTEAEKVFERKTGVSPEDSTWVDEMFALAESIRDQIEGENVGRGRGEVHEKMFRVETPYGSLKVSLTTPVE